MYDLPVSYDLWKTTPPEYDRWLSEPCEEEDHEVCQVIPADVKALYPCECRCHEESE